MTKEEREKVIDALKISAPIHALTEEEFNDYIQTLNKAMDWLEQEPKTGHWIKTKEQDDAEPLILWKCSECLTSQRLKTKYCPNCGAKMIKPQERSDKE